MMFEKRKVLDHGYAGLVGHWGSDEEIIEAARMSTGRGFISWDRYVRCEEDECEYLVIKPTEIPLTCPICKGDVKEYPEGDNGLLRFLWKHKHSTPFEMAGMTIEIQAPLFVFREWHRHRTQSYNELSARYIKMKNINYMPSVDRLFPETTGNKQAGTVKGALKLTQASGKDWLAMLADYYDQGEFIYERGCAQGVPKEIARLCVPVGRYSRMRASANLRNWLAFLTLRMDPKAQWEIREYANMVGTMVAEKFPRTWQLFIEGKK